MAQLLSQSNTSPNALQAVDPVVNRGDFAQQVDKFVKLCASILSPYDRYIRCQTEPLSHHLLQSAATVLWVWSV